MQNGWRSSQQKAMCVLPKAHGPAKTMSAGLEPTTFGVFQRRPKTNALPLRQDTLLEADLIQLSHDSEILYCYKLSHCMLSRPPCVFYPLPQRHPCDLPTVSFIRYLVIRESLVSTRLDTLRLAITMLVQRNLGSVLKALTSRSAATRTFRRNQAEPLEQRGEIDALLSPGLVAICIWSIPHA
jgi:hypothetical protein